MSIKWGVIGTGGIAREFIEDVLNYTDMEIVAIGSRSQTKAESFADSISKPIKAIGSYEELVNLDVDAIYVATPHQAHCENSILALNAGKPVLCEKPFAVNAIEAQQMARLAKSNQLLIMEAMWTRYLPHIKRIRELLPELGEIYSLEADHGQSLLHINRLVDPNYAGGALLDLGVYPISFASMVFGEPDRIVARSDIQNGVDLQTSAILEYSEGRQSIITTNMKVKSATRATVSGSKARIEIDSSFYRPTDFRVVLEDGNVREFKNDYRGHGLREQAIYFENLLIRGKLDSEYLPISESISIMQTMDEIRNQIGLRYPFER